ncbi:MAG TPA: hypothetical protein VI751_00605 [Actinomycetota bacterium]|jgi:hypothetical protein
MSTPHSQPGGGDAVGRLLRSAWRYKGLIVAAVLVGALLGYGWAARQPTLYEGVSGMRMIDCPDTYLCLPFRSQARRMSSSEVLQRAVTLSGGRISAVTLGQRLEVKITPDPRLIKIRVVDSTPEGAAELANGVTLAYREVVIEQDHKVIRRLRSQMLSDLKTRLAGIDAELAGRPNDPGLREQRNALAAQLPRFEVGFDTAFAAARVDRYLQRDVAAVPEQPIQPRPGRTVTVAIGMLVGLLISGALAWWRTRRQGPTSRSSTPEQGPELPSPA